MILLTELTTDKPSIRCRLNYAYWYPYTNNQAVNQNRQMFCIETRFPSKYSFLLQHFDNRSRIMGIHFRSWIPIGYLDENVKEYTVDDVILSKLMTILA